MLSGARKRSAWSRNFKTGSRRNVALSILGQAPFRMSFICFFMAFLLSRGSLLGFIWPFGLAYYAVAVAYWPHFALISTLGVFLGKLSLGSMTNALGALPQLFLIWFAMTRALPDKRGSRLIPLVVMLIGSAAGTLMHAFMGTLDVGLIPTLFESFIAACLSFPLSFFVPKIPSLGYAQGLGWHEKIGMTVLATGMIIGMGTLTLWGISLAGVTAGAVVILGSAKGGVGGGTISGVIMGTALSLSNAVPFPLTSAFAVGGLISGIFSSYGKLIMVLAFFLGAGIFSHQVPNATAVLPFIWGLAISSILFVVTPKRWLWLIPGFEKELSPRRSADVSIYRDNRSITIASRKLDQVKSIFDELARDLAAVPDLSGISDRALLVSLLNDISRLACHRCGAYLTCWRDNFHRTYRNLVDLLALAELKGVLSPMDARESTGSWCHQSDRISQAVASCLESWRMKMRSRGFQQERKIISLQLKGISEIMQGLVSELETAAYFDAARESALRKELKGVGLPVRAISVTRHFGRYFEIVVNMDKCGGVAECRRALLPVLKNILGEDLSVSQTSCGWASGRPSCELRIIPSVRLKVQAIQVRQPKPGSSVCGDTSYIAELPDGRVLMIISDGMGSGQDAAIQSRAAVTMLRRLIEAGFGHEFAAKTTNSLLLLRSPGETFATVDLAVIDLYTGEAEFIKIGSCPSYIRRRRGVDVIKSQSLPAGVLNSVDVEKSATRLRPGDLLIMASDGIGDPRILGSDREGTIARILRKVPPDDPHATARALMDKLSKGRERGFTDDITLIVAKISLRSERQRPSSGKNELRVAGSENQPHDTPFESYSQVGWFA